MKGLTSALMSLSLLPPARGAAPAVPRAVVPGRGGSGPCSAAKGSLSFSSAELRVLRVERHLLSLEPAVDLQHFPSIKSHRWIHESMRKSLISSWGSSASPLAGAGSALLSDAHVEFF